MAENETTTTTITPENAMEVFTSAAYDFSRSRAGTKGRERLLAILQNNDSNTRAVLATCMNKGYIVEAFTRSSFKNDVDLMQAFHDLGMSVDAKDFYDSCALTVATNHGHEESVRWLLDHDANVNIQDIGSATALMYASRIGNIAFLELLLEKNANLDIQEKKGATALMWASSAGHKDIVQLLLNHNADIDLKDKQGKTALDFAKSKKIKEMLKNHVTTSYVLK